MSEDTDAAGYRLGRRLATEDAEDAEDAMAIMTVALATLSIISSLVLVTAMIVDERSADARELLIEITAQSVKGMPTLPPIPDGAGDVAVQLHAEMSKGLDLATTILEAASAILGSEP